jgi:hypothetical protein
VRNRYLARGLVITSTTLPLMVMARFSARVEPGLKAEQFGSRSKGELMSSVLYIEQKSILVEMTFFAFLAPRVYAIVLGSRTLDNLS